MHLEKTSLWKCIKNANSRRSRKTFFLQCAFTKFAKLFLTTSCLPHPINLCICVYICVYICCMHACITHVMCMRLYMFIYMRICLCMLVFACVCLCVFMCVRAHGGVWRKQTKNHVAVWHYLRRVEWTSRTRLSAAKTALGLQLWWVLTWCSVEIDAHQTVQTCPKAFTAFEVILLLFQTNAVAVF